MFYWCTLFIPLKCYWLVMFNHRFYMWWSPVSSWPCHWRRIVHVNRKWITWLFKTTWALIEKRNLSTHCQHLPLFLFLCPFSLLKGGGALQTEMKIPFLCNVYSVFSHIRSRSDYSLPPLFTIFPDESGLEPAIACRWKGRQKGEDGNEAEGRDKRSLRGLWPPLGTCFAVRPRWPPRPQLPVEEMCQRMFWVSHGKRLCLSR